MYPDPTSIVLLLFSLIFPSFFIIKMILRANDCLSYLQAFLISQIIWLFIFLSGTIISGILGFVLSYFYVFKIISLTLSVVGIGYNLISIKRPHKITLKFSLSELPICLSVILLIVLGTSLILFHHIWSEFDAISIYIPQAESILITNSLSYNPFDSSTVMMMSSSGLYTSYAYVLYLVQSLEMLRLIPIVFFVFGILSTYLLARELLLDKLSALMVVAVFLSFIAVLKTFAQFSLYTDIAFTFLLIFLVFSLTKWVKDKNNFWLGICGLTLTLMLFFKPFGYIIAPTVFGLFLLYTKPRWCHYLGILIAFLPIHLETFIFILKPCFSMSFSPTYVGDVINLLIRWSPVAVLSVVILLILRKQHNKLPVMFNWKNFLVFILPIIIFLVYIIYYIVKFDLLLISHQLLNPASMNQMLSLYYQIIPITRASAFSYYSWYNLLSGGLAGAFIIPLIVGVYATVRYLTKRVEFLPSVIPSILIIATLLVLWSYLGAGYEPRRLFLFGPFIAVTIVIGVGFLSKILKIPKKIGLVSLCVFNAVSLGYFWTQIEDISLINERGFALSPFNIIDYYVLNSIFIFIILLPKLLALALNKFSLIGFKNTILKRLPKMTTIVVIIGLLSQLILVSGILAYYDSVNGFNNDFNSPISIAKYYNETGKDTKYLLGDFTRVIDYFNRLDDDYAVLGFYIHYLPLFTNRSVIDLTWPYGYEAYSQTLIKNGSIALESLYQNNIRYVLIPNNQYPISWVYQTYLNAKSVLPVLNESTTSLTAVLSNRDYALIPLQHFMCYDLFKVSKIEKSLVNPICFNSSDSIVISNTSKIKNMQSFTIEALIYMDDLPSTTQQHFEISGQSWNSLRLFISKESNKLSIVQSLSEGQNLVYSSSMVLQAKQWYSIAITYNMNSLKIYIDGLKDAELTRAGVPIISDSPLILHGFSNNITSTSGRMAGFRLYDRALTSEEILWNNDNLLNPIEKNLVMWFKFIESSGNVLNDYSTSEQNAVARILGAHWVTSVE